MKDPIDAKNPWSSLGRALLIAIIIAVFPGLPLGFLAAVCTWIPWMFWAVPAALGLLIFLCCAAILTTEYCWKRW
jgi:hypothetical protein